MEHFVETYLCKLRGILRSRVLRVLCIVYISCCIHSATFTHFAAAAVKPQTTQHTVMSVHVLILHPRELDNCWYKLLTWYTDCDTRGGKSNKLIANSSGGKNKREMPAYSTRKHKKRQAKT